jgi:hypothetical protein
MDSERGLRQPGRGSKTTVMSSNNHAIRRSGEMRRAHRPNAGFGGAMMRVTRR